MSQRAAAGALVASGVIVCLQFLLFLVIGIALAAFFATNPTDPPLGAADGDRAFAHFIVHNLGRGLVGLTLAAVFSAAMSTLSSSLNSSATALVNDIYLPLRRTELSPTAQLAFSRLATIGFGAVQIAIALASHYLGTTESTISKVLAIAGFATGPVLGLYFLAVLARRVEQPAAISGFIAGLALLTWVALSTAVFWPWYAVIGSIATFVFGVIASFLFPPDDSYQHLPEE